MLLFPPPPPRHCFPPTLAGGRVFFRTAFWPRRLPRLMKWTRSRRLYIGENLSFSSADYSKISTTLGKWFAFRYYDRITERSDLMFQVRAAELRKILVQLGPAYVKIAQAISSRPI